MVSFALLLAGPLFSSGLEKNISVFSEVFYSKEENFF
jgi:hypothetical protein